MMITWFTLCIEGGGVGVGVGVGTGVGVGLGPGPGVGVGVGVESDCAEIPIPPQPLKAAVTVTKIRTTIKPETGERFFFDFILGSIPGSAHGSAVRASRAAECDLGC